MQGSNPHTGRNLGRRIEELPVSRVKRATAHADYLAAESNLDRLAHLARWVRAVVDASYPRPALRRHAIAPLDSPTVI